MYYSFSLMEGLLAQSRIALNNALQYPELKDRLLEFGVDENRIQEGLNLRAEAEKLLDNKTFKYGEQIGLTAELNNKIDNAYKRYMNFLKLARFSVKDNIEYQRSLGTIGPRLMSLSGWMRQARQFYENAINNDDILQLLSRFSITKEKLQEGLDLLPEIEALDNEQESKKGAFLCTYIEDQSQCLRHKRLVR